jgi:DnaJ-class molecular chaperone
MGVNPYRRKIYEKPERKVILECSRCSGCGYQNPLDIDSSICFSCMGAGVIELRS